MTERVRVAQALRESAERLRMVSDNIPGSVIYQSVTEPDGTVRYSYISAGVERLFGFTAESVMQDAAAFRQLIVEEDRPLVAAAEQEALHDSRPLECEFRWRTATGGIKWVRRRSTPQPQDDGSIVWNGVITDITARRQLQEEARARQIRLGMALEAAGMVTWEWDIPSRSIRYSNNISAIVRGAAVEPYCSLDTLLPEIHPEDREKLADTLEQTSRTGRPWECEYRTRMLDGTYRWILGQGKHVVMEGGHPVRVLGLSIDITERKEAEEKVRRSEARFRLLADTAERLLETPDPQGLVNQLCREVMAFLDCQVFFNYLAMEGPGPAVGAGRGSGPVARLRLNACAGVPDEEVPRVEWLDYGVTVCGCVARDGRRIVVEDIQHCEDPRTMLVKSLGVQAYCCHPLLIEGRVMGTLSFGTTTRRRFTAEEVGLMRAIAGQVAVAMRRLEMLRALEAKHGEAVSERNRLAAVMETLPVGVCILDARGGLVRCNRAYEELWGGPIPTVRSVRDYASYEARWTASGEPVQPEEWASARAVQHGETVVNQELQIQRFDGAQAYVLNSAAPIRDAEGRVIGCAVAIQDITDRKEAEERHRELELRVQRAQKEESLGTLAGGIAHDFNNLLTVILGNLDLVSWKLPEESLDRRLLGKAADASRDAADLCQQLLAYVGKAQLSFRSVHLNRLLEDMARLMVAALSRRGQLRWNLALDVPLVSADLGRLRQIIMNLIVNASEALGDEPGRITISTGSAHLAAEDLQSPWVQDPLAPGEYVFLEVADTGCGIEPELIGRLFEPFFSTKFTGRGLGLAAVIGIVRAHHGMIQVESDPGRGSRFRVWLPALACTATATEPLAVAAPDWRGAGTILVVDDEEAVRVTATKMLELLGFEVICAADGLEAIEIYRADPRRFRGVILDATMPNLDGIATFRELVRIREDVRVVLSSGYARDDIVAPLEGRGLSGFLQKPYTLHDLVAVLQGLPEHRELG